jgi:hypothetical protein
MKTQNKILEKLIELGYQKPRPFSDAFTFDALEDDTDYIGVLNALVSECGKRDLRIIIHDNIFSIYSNTGYLHYDAKYTRSNIAVAFMKVTGRYEKEK